MSKRAMVICPECGGDKEVPNAGRGMCSKHYHQWRRAHLREQKDTAEAHAEAVYKPTDGWTLKGFLASC